MHKQVNHRKYFFSFLALFLCLQGFSQNKILLGVTAIVDKEYSSLVTLYKKLHSRPELSEQEKETSALMAEELRKSGFEVTEGIGGYGVAGILKNGPGPVVLIRTDMDALPLQEQTGIDYASKVQAKDKQGNDVSVMHACGHDMHMAVWTGVARVLSQFKTAWKGTLLFIAQPAEELGLGALGMIEGGLFAKFPIPDYALALHVNSAVEAGKIGFCPAYSLANIDMLDITIKGKGGHSASPHTTIDPVVIASKLVLAFQDIISRETPPMQPAVISVGSIHGGTTGNIIPSQVKLELSVRSLDDAIHKQLIQKIKRTCEGIALSSGVAPEDYPVVEIRKPGSPAVYNDPGLTEKVSSHLRELLGNENVLKLGPEMYGEDFGRYGRMDVHVPILLYSLGAVRKEDMQASEAGKLKLPSTHSPLFLPDTSPALRTGVLSMSLAIMYLLNSQEKK